ncbi:filamentous hemagglutinin, partial [Desulfomicrobium norvegicum]
VGQRGAIEATGDLSMQAGRDIGIIGSDVKAGGDATFSAGRDVIIAAQELESHNFGKTGKSKSSLNTQSSKAATVEAGGSVRISAGQDVAVHGSSVSAGTDVNIEADRDVSITAATDGYDYHFKQKSKGGFFGGSSSEMHKGKVTTNVASAITAGGDVHVAAGQGGIGDLTVAGSKIKSGEDMGLRAEDGMQILPVRVENYAKAESKESGFMGTGSMKLDESHGSANVRSELSAGGKVSLEAGDSVVLQAARITSGDETAITAENGQVAMLVSKDSFFERHVESDTGYFSWSSSDKGKQDEAVQHTEISARKLSITTANGVVVQYRETGNVRQDIEQLAQAPGLGWMGELLKRDDVNWQAVQEAHDQWKHEDGGIGGPGVQLVALAIAVALTVTGVGAAFATALTGINTATGAAATAATASATAGATTAASLTATQLAVHSAVAAGFNSLVTQATVQLVANQGDVGAVLKAMTTEDTVRSLATVMLTAGLTSGLMSATDVANDPGLLSQAKDMTATMKVLSTALERTAIQAGVSAGVNTAINGGDLGKNFTNSLRTAAVITLGAQVAGEIGLATREGDLNYVTNKIAHAALGAAMGEALSGDAAAGAIGAVVGEMAAEAFVQRFVYSQIDNPEALMNLTDEEALQLKADLIRLESTGVDMGRLAAGIAAAVAERDIDTAATTGGNAAENNAFFVIPVLLEFMDKGLQAYDAYRLAKAIDAGDTDEAADIASEIALGAATDAIPANVVAIKIVSAVEKFGLAGLGAKIVGKFGDEAGDAWRVAGKAVHKTGFDEVTEFIGQHGKLPDNFITKKEAKALGWDSSKGNLHEIAPGKSIGGDIYENRSGILPDAPDRTWIEVDINYDQGYRGAERLIISNDGLMYKTTDHYKSFQRIR